MKRVYDWQAIQEYYDDGNGFRACNKRFGVTHFSWAKAIRRGDLKARLTTLRWPRTHDWPSIQKHYDQGHSIRACCRHFGLSIAAWDKARKRGEIRSRRQSMSIEQLLDGAKRNRSHVKGRLLNAGLLANRCEACDITEWRGGPLNMQLDHINGMKNDNRLANLRMLCPNCHSQTPTFSGRNLKRIRGLQGAAEVV